MHAIDHALNIILTSAAACSCAASLADLLKRMSALADGAFDIVVGDDFAQADYHV